MATEGAGDWGHNSNHNAHLSASARKAWKGKSVRPGLSLMALGGRWGHSGRQYVRKLTVFVWGENKQQDMSCRPGRACSAQSQAPPGWAAAGKSLTLFISFLSKDEACHGPRSQGGCGNETRLYTKSAKQCRLWKHQYRWARVPLRVGAPQRHRQGRPPEQGRGPLAAAPWPEMWLGLRKYVLAGEGRDFVGWWGAEGL